jgi:glycosyltransferase involved in cell wall biosynthesis
MPDFKVIAANDAAPDMSPMVSVLVINYNNAAYIHACLNSIVEQTYDDYEVIIADDCSTDDSNSEIQKCLSQYPKLTFKYIRHETNAGNPSATCNTALSHARGKYISIISSDDAMHDRKLEIQVAELENTDDKVAALYSDAKLMNREGEQIFGSFIQYYRDGDFNLPQADMFNDLCKRNFIPAMSLLYKKKVFDAVGNFDEKLTFEDYDMLLRIADKYTIKFSDYVSVSYRFHPENLSKSCSWMPSTMAVMLKHQDTPAGYRRLKTLSDLAVVHSTPDCLHLLRNAKKKEIQLRYLIGKLPGGVFLKEQYLRIAHILVMLVFYCKCKVLGNIFRRGKVSS